jgi:NADPH:quinone reductase-like Zn-dependent oxidoreductase
LPDPNHEDEDVKHRRVVVSKHGGPEVLRVTEEPLPEPEPGKVRVRVEAAGVSAYDLMMRASGIFPGMPKVPFTLGEDLVGVVDALGEGAEGIDLGQRVGAWTFGRGGTYAEHVCIEDWEAVPVPDGLPSSKAVCLVVNYLTAYAAMHVAANTREGERVLIHGAAGGVGSALLHLGRLAGLQMYGTASAKNRELVSSLGATPIDYRSEDFVARVREQSGAGVDVVFDPVGGNRQLRRSYQALKPGGRLLWFGMAATKTHGLRAIPATMAALAWLKLRPRGRAVALMENLDRLAARDGWYRAVMTEVFAHGASGEIDPLVAASFPLEEAAVAHEFLERGGHAGKVVLLMEGTG